MFDEDLEPQKEKPKPKNLENMSIDEMEAYIEDMKTEIIRVEEEIGRKKTHMDAASSAFK